MVAIHAGGTTTAQAPCTEGVTLQTLNSPNFCKNNGGGQATAPAPQVANAPAPECSKLTMIERIKCEAMAATRK
jgi:hypothetical protein